jgi:hypothetical protein
MALSAISLTAQRQAIQGFSGSLLDGSSSSSSSISICLANASGDELPMGIDL